MIHTLILRLFIIQNIWSGTTGSFWTDTVPGLTATLLNLNCKLPKFYHFTKLPLPSSDLVKKKKQNPIKNKFEWSGQRLFDWHMYYNTSFNHNKYSTKSLGGTLSSSPPWFCFELYFLCYLLSYTAFHLNAYLFF